MWPVAIILDSEALVDPNCTTKKLCSIYCCSVTKSHPTLQPHGLQRARLLCPPLSPRVCSLSCPLNQWCYLTISSSASPFSFCFQSYFYVYIYRYVYMFVWVSLCAQEFIFFSNTQNTYEILLDPSGQDSTQFGPIPSLQHLFMPLCFSFINFSPLACTNSRHHQRKEQRHSDAYDKQGIVRHSVWLTRKMDSFHCLELTDKSWHRNFCSMQLDYPKNRVSLKQVRIWLKAGILETLSGSYPNCLAP